jgi:hypothetical protein
MTLTGTNGSTFSVRIAGYQFPDINDDEDTSNWLNVEVSLEGFGQRWKSVSPSLMTWELEILADWFKDIFRGNNSFDDIGFIEPNLRFRLMKRDEDTLHIRTTLSLECKPSWWSDADQYTFDLSVDASQIKGAIENLKGQMRHFPQRAVNNKNLNVEVNKIPNDMPDVLYSQVNSGLNVNLANPAITHQFDTEVGAPYITMWMDEDFLCCRYASNLHLSLNVAKSCVESRIFFAKGKSYPLLVDMGGIKSTTREARQYMASIGATLVKGCALITGSAVNRTIGNIFLAIDKPEVPTKLFTSEANARLWLKQYV